MNTAFNYNQALGAGEPILAYSQEEVDAMIDDASEQGWSTGFDSGFDTGVDKGVDTVFAQPRPLPLPDTGGAGTPTEPAGNWWDKYLAPEKVQQVLSAKTAYELNAINIERLKKGQAPLPASYMTAVAPRVNVGLPQDQLNMLLIGGASLLGILMLSRK